MTVTLKPPIISTNIKKYRSPIQVSLKIRNALTSDVKDGVNSTLLNVENVQLLYLEAEQLNIYRFNKDGEINNSFK